MARTNDTSTTAKGSRASALWGKGPRLVGLLALCAVLAVPASSLAADPGGQAAPAVDGSTLSPGLLQAIQANPNARVSVIVQGELGQASGKLLSRITKGLARQSGGDAGQVTASVRDRFTSVDGLSLTLPGKLILKLAHADGVVAITPDVAVATDGGPGNPQHWADAAGSKWYWGQVNKGSAATIAFIDSGIDNSSGNFGNRIVASADLGGGSASGDPRGHGTFVASLGAGAGTYAGVAPNANLVSLDVFDANGQGRTSNVIRACDWLLQNQARYNIRVANFSLQTAQPSTFLYDPLDQAVEQLWRSGIVVVAAAGNYAVNGQPSGVKYAPGNDPFVITVGAVDLQGHSNTDHATAAPWSAFGYTLDGFAKPELGAPGRYMIAQLPQSATLRAAFPGHDVKNGGFELSGTSFSAPIVSGIASALMGAHPDWTPDQVKGALMLTAQPMRNAAPLSVGVGEANLQKAFEQFKDASRGAPPNPNAALEQFVVPGPPGSPPVFDTEAWKAAAQASASWSSASWSSASWSSASWSSASWSSASWTSASWSSASWTSASWTSAAGPADAAANNASGDGLGDG